MIPIDAALEGPIYDDDQLKAFADILGIEEWSQEQVAALEQAALGYIFLAALPEEPPPDQADQWARVWPKRKEIAKALESAAARKSTSAHQDEDLYPLWFLESSEIKTLETAKSPEAFAKHARAFAEMYRKPGRDSVPERRIFIRELATIFEAATKRPPTMRRNKDDDRLAGPFHDFVRDALTPLDPHRASTLESDIRAVLKERKRQRP